MTYKIYLDQEIGNLLGTNMVTVDNLTVNDGYITVGDYHVPLSKIVLIKQIT